MSLTRLPEKYASDYQKMFALSVYYDETAGAFILK